MEMTPNMLTTLAQVCDGSPFVDVRSAAALTRRGLALPCRDKNGIRYRLYEPTDKGKRLLAEKRAGQQAALLEALAGHSARPRPSSAKARWSSSPWPPTRHA